ncbi:MAG: NTF2 fold immunity protein [Flavobacteriales bacterium]
MKIIGSLFLFLSPLVSYCQNARDTVFPLGTLKYEGKVYYITEKSLRLSPSEVCHTVVLLTLENEKTSDTSLQKPLVIEIALDTAQKDLPLMRFDEAEKILLVPQVINNKISGDYLAYKFNGRYFECSDFEDALDHVMLTLSDSSAHNVINTQSILIKDKEMALTIAEPILFDIYGKTNILHQKPYKIKYVEVYWVIEGSLDEGAHGGVFLLIMDSRNGQIVRITHGK